MGTLEYDSNNSGGSWWLSDENWFDLEEAGWKVNWKKDELDPLFRHSIRDGRWLGALATSASKEFNSEREGIAEWERITGQSERDNGCECCGPPHRFWFKQ